MPHAISDGWFHRLKAAQRDLIERAGGIERAAAKTSISKSQIGRCNSATDVELLPLGAVLVLEADTGAALVTAVMASLNGRRLIDPDSEGQGPAGVLQRHSEAVRQAGELMASGAAAFADGKLTPSELQQMDRTAAKLEEATSELRKALGNGRAAGGEVVPLTREGA